MPKRRLQQRTSKGLTKKKSQKGGKYVQARLQIGTLDKSMVKCDGCEMTYSQASVDDLAAHSKFHDLHVKGRSWSHNWGLIVCKILPKSTSGNIAEEVLMTPPSSSSSSSVQSSFSNHQDKIVMVQPTAPNEVKATLEILEMVNNELNAPQDENGFWMDREGQGKAFVYVKNDKAVGIITMEVLDASRGRWMVLESKSIVDNARPEFLLGISRIWVCKKYRYSGIATKLLEAARINTIYGADVDKYSIAWSQPTESGSKLALKYNSIKHKSGKLLIPCYI